MSPVELAAVVTLGLLLGMRHATDADHVVAVAAIVSRGKKAGGAWRIGALWGLGHSATILVVGGLIILAKIVVPERVAMSFEFLVGAVLVVMGISNLAGGRSMFGEGLHSHSHDHDHHEHSDDNGGKSEENGKSGTPTHFHPAGNGKASPFSAPPFAHEHPHVHADEPALKRLAGDLEPAQAARSFFLGLIHGLAGSAAVALLVLATIPGPVMGMVYLAVFGLGTLLGMAFVTALMEASFAAAAGRFRLERWLVPATGLSSFLFGSYMMYQIGYVDGLFR